jgi:hypothetical protein
VRANVEGVGALLSNAGSGVTMSDSRAVASKHGGSGDGRSTTNDQHSLIKGTRILIEATRMAKCSQRKHGVARVEVPSPARTVKSPLSSQPHRAYRTRHASP